MKRQVPYKIRVRIGEKLKTYFRIGKTPEDVCRGCKGEILWVRKVKLTDK